MILFLSLIIFWLVALLVFISAKTDRLEHDLADAKYNLAVQIERYERRSCGLIRLELENMIEGVIIQ